VSRLELMVEPKAAPARRVEVITGSSGRRRWTDDEKARVVEETLQPDAVVSEIARRYGLTPQQLFTWRRAMRRKSAADESAVSPAFVPAVVEPAESATPEIKTIARPPVIELDIGGDSVWIWRGADAAVVTAIIGALKAPR
jgi:transposase